MDKVRRLARSFLAKIRFEVYRFSIETVRTFRLGRFVVREKIPEVEIVRDYTCGTHRWVYWCPLCLRTVEPDMTRCICGQRLDWDWKQVIQ